ncbi:hypothetical protein [Haliangium sp.]|uniref:hypothetical protein n=1 Tax=Haliangium sp. TaxID=2663208 RepID=UPI003D0B9353
MSVASTIGPIEWQVWQMPTASRIERPALDVLGESPLGAGDDALFLRGVAHGLRVGRDAECVTSSSDAPLWLGDVYSLVARQQPDEAIDILFDHIDELLSEGQFARCDSVLRAIDLDRLDTNLVVAVLSITLSAADELPHRARLLSRAEKRLSVLAPERVERLLHGLR